MSRRNVKLFEDLEIEILLWEWDLDDNGFDDFFCICFDGFGSLIEFLVDEWLFGYNIGFLFWIKGGGCVRFMSSLLFRNCKDVLCLIM